MQIRKRSGEFLGVAVFTAILTMVLAGCGDDGASSSRRDLPGQVGDAQRGQAVLRFETFGNEGFWTDAARLVKGVSDARLTPLQALRMGLSVNTEALDADTQAALSAEIRSRGTRGPLLNDFATTLKLINANAVIGVVVKDTNRDGRLDVASGDKAGVSCVLCHAVTDRSVFNLASGGSIGKEIDGPANHRIAIGKIFAAADNTRAFFPMAQLKQADGTSIGRAPSARGLTKTSTEAEFDAYFGDPEFYPPGMFDDTVDGNGNPVHNTPLFRQDLAAPFGSAGELALHDQFANTVYTALLDPTNILTPGGRAFLSIAAKAAGERLANDYAEVLAATGVENYPYVQADRSGRPGDPDTLFGARVDDQKLFDMNAYVFSLRSPPGVVRNAAAVERGRALFGGSSLGCVSCHGASPSEPVPRTIVDMAAIFPGDAPRELILRDPPAVAVQDTPGNTFDDKQIVINASLRGLNRGNALPLLMDLARKPVFLHDDSVRSLEALFTPRGSRAPHPFYLSNRAECDDMVAYLESLDDSSL